MASVYMDVEGPTSLRELIATLDPSAPDPANRRAATVGYGNKGLTVTTDCDPRDKRTYAVDIEGVSNTDRCLHNAAVQISNKMARKKWDVRVVPTFAALCAPDTGCQVCHRIGGDSRLDREKLAGLVADAADLDDSVRQILDALIDSGPPESIIEAAVLGTRTALSAYLCGRIHQLIAAGVYGSQQEREIIEALDAFNPKPDRWQVVGKNLAKKLSVVADLTAADRESVIMDIEAGDYQPAIYDAVCNARSKLPEPLTTRVRRMLKRGWFSDSADSLSRALEWHSQPDIEVTPPLSRNHL